MNNKKTKEQSCTLCGYNLHTLAFKGGYICEDCIHSLKEGAPTSSIKKK